MSEAKHTPGPWSIQAGSSNPLIGSADCTVAEVLDDCFPDTEQQKANANLIAAAPALLEACELAQHLMPYIHADQFDGHAAETFRKIDAALKLAKGGAA